MASWGIGGELPIRAEAEGEVESPKSEALSIPLIEYAKCAKCDGHTAQGRRKKGIC